MVILEYSVIEEIIEDLDSTIGLISSREDECLAEALDKIIDTSLVLKRSLDSYDKELDEMANYFQQQGDYDAEG